MDVSQDELDRILDIYYAAFPLGGPRDGADPVTDALIDHIRRADANLKDAIKRIQEHAYHLKCAEDERAFERSRISALLDAVKPRLVIMEG